MIECGLPLSRVLDALQLLGLAAAACPFHSVQITFLGTDASSKAKVILGSCIPLIAPCLKLHACHIICRMCRSLSAIYRRVSSNSFILLQHYFTHTFPVLLTSMPSVLVVRPPPSFWLHPLIIPPLGLRHSSSRIHPSQRLSLVRGRLLFQYHC